ncbi:MAG: hypothetical protein K2X77_33595 [Candidatus Obscuribacterales bacterium]|jgi:hypothetical protein|nr:hypothetical protein [Candidatus Obscuribacterales bacterium]
MEVKKTALIGPQALFNGLVATYVNVLKEAISQDPHKKAALQITEERLSDEIVQGVKRRMEAEGYIVEGPAPNLICRMILLVSERQPDPREVAIERFRSYVWSGIKSACVRDRVEFPHKIDLYSDAQPDHIRVVLRELRRRGWKASYRTGAKYITVDRPSQSFTQ